MSMEFITDEFIYYLFIPLLVLENHHSLLKTFQYIYAIHTIIVKKYF